MPNTNTSAGSTEIFRMPAADSTIPDLMGTTKPAHPTLTIVKGPQIGETFELDAPEITLGRDPKNSVFLNDMTVSRRHATMDLSNSALMCKSDNWAMVKPLKAGGKFSISTVTCRICGCFSAQKDP